MTTLVAFVWNHTFLELVGALCVRVCIVLLIRISLMSVL